MRIIFISLFISLSTLAAPTASEIQKAEELKTFLNQEKPGFEKRETQKKDLIEVLDTLNATQNKVRERLMTLTANQQELSMALENLQLEFQKQKQLESLQRQRLSLLLKIVYKIKKEGIVRFVLFGHDLSDLAGRIRILYRTLKSHSMITEQLKDRAERLNESEAKLNDARRNLSGLLVDLKDQEQILAGLLKQKQALVKQISQKQTSYQAALKEYKRISSQLTTVFNALPSKADKKAPHIALKDVKGSLPLPVMGSLLKRFGRQIHEKFGTVTYNKGIEIAAEHGASVKATLEGIVEYSGWIKGLGNVMILHHGGGLYTLNAHLFRSAKEVGNHVDQGEVLGQVGDTGDSDRPSLYFEVREQGKAVDPLAYFSKDSFTSLN